MANYNILDCFVSAFLHTQKVLFKKFELKTYLFCMFLTIFSCGVYGVDYRYYVDILGKMPVGEGMKLFLLPVFKILFSPQNIVISEIIIAILMIVAIVFLFYLSFTFRLLFFDFNIFKNKYDFKEYWNRNKDKSANIIKYFLKQFLYIFILACFLFIAADIVHPHLGDFAEHKFALFVYIAMICAFIVSLFIFMRMFAILCISGIFILPLYPIYEKNIKLDDALKSFYSETKGKFWKSLLFFFVLGCVHNLFLICFLPGLLLFRTVVASLASVLSINAFYPVFICLLIIYLAIIAIVNVPIAVYFNSFYQLMCSLLCPNYAILLPIKDDKGKIIDTMTYFEHLDLKKEQVEDMNEVNNSQD